MIHNPVFPDPYHLQLGHILNQNRQSKFNSDKQQHSHQENTEEKSSFAIWDKATFPQPGSLFSSSITH